MRHWLGILLTAAPMFLVGCTTVRAPDAPVEPAGPAVAPRAATESENLLGYFQHVRKLTAPELAKELDSVRQLYGSSRSDATRVRLAMVLSVPGSALYDDARALEVLDPLLKNPASPLHPIAFMVSAQIQERRRGVAFQQRYESEQRRGHALQQKLDEEQKRGQGLQQKLDALKSLEKSLLERESDGGARRR